jgi:hypothetical protein
MFLMFLMFPMFPRLAYYISVPANSINMHLVACCDHILYSNIGIMCVLSGRHKICVIYGGHRIRGKVASRYRKSENSVIRSKETCLSSIGLDIEALPQDSFTLLSVSIALSRISQLTPFASRHESMRHGRRQFIFHDLTNPTFHFSGDHYPSRYMFVPPDILTTAR